MYNEELLDEGFSKVGVPIDDEQIKECASGIEEKIRSAKSRKEAKMIVHDSYRCFEKCESEMIPLLLKRYVKNLYEDCWGESR
jgi:hypothetical protein